MNQYVKITKKLCASDGGELLRYSLSYPEIIGEQGGIKKINDFYRTIREGCESFCIGELSAFCEKKRAECGIYRPYSYRLGCAVSFEDENIVSVIMSASLKRQGDTCFVGEYTSAQVFSKSDGMLIPPSLILKKYAPEIKSPKKYIRKNKLKGICLTEQGVTCLREGVWVSVI